MSALIIGGDRISTYRDFLADRGYMPVRHWNGRKQSEVHRQIPIDTRLVVVMIDQVNHNLAKKVRRAAEDRQLPVVYCRRSVGQLGSVVSALSEH